MTTFAMAGLGWLLAAALGGTPAAPAEVVDAPSDAVALPSSACAPSGSPCAWVEGDQLRFQDGTSVQIPVGADRLAVSADGLAAFVAPVRGWPAVHLVTVDHRVVLVTNVDLQRVPGRAPEGFVAPPVREGDLRIEVDGVAWMLPDGTQVRVAFPALAEPRP